MQTYSRPPYRRGLEPSCLGTLMMITRVPVSRSCALSWTGLSVARLYVMVTATSKWLRCYHSSPDPSPRRKRAYSRVGCHVTPRWPERLKGGLDWTFRPTLCVLPRSGLFGGEGCKNFDRTGACSLSRFP